MSTWHAKTADMSGYLPITSPECRDNGTEMARVFYNAGWSLLAISAALGVWSHESGLNPWSWEGAHTPTVSEFQSWTPQQARVHGYGLAGFTPPSLYINQDNASLEGYAPNFSDRPGQPSDGNAQTLFLTSLVERGWTHNLYNYYNNAFNASGLWPRDYISRFYWMTFEEFKTEHRSIDDLTGALLLCFGKGNAEGSALSLASRQQDAQGWYEYFTENPPGPPGPTPAQYKSMPIWFYLRPPF